LGVDLRDKLVLITGASAGIGREASLAFARNGAHVIGLARNVASVHAAIRQPR